MQANMTSTILPTCASTAAAGRSAASLARTSSAIESFELAAARQKLGARAEGIGRAAFALGFARVRAVAQDEAAADREPGLAGERRPGCVARKKAKRVRVARRRRDDVEDDRARRVEGDPAAAGDRQAIRLAHLVDQRVRRVRIDRLRGEAAEAEHDRLVGRVAAPGEGERAQKRDFDRGDALEVAAPREAGGEGGGRLHRPDRVRRRRADADLEELEDADHRMRLTRAAPQGFQRQE